MVMGHNINAMFICRNLQSISARQSVCLQRLSSGKRINSAADDAAGLAICEGMEAQIRGLRQANRNVQDGISLIQVADGNLNSVHEMLQRMRELTVRAANGTNSSSDIEAIKSEISQLTDELNRITGAAEFNTKKIFDGSSDKVTIQVGPNSGDTVDIQFDNLGNIISGMGKPYFTSNTTAGDFLDKVDIAIKQVSGYRGKLGAYENRFERIIDMNENYADNLEAAKSRIEDADMAKEMMEYSKLNILEQVSTALLAQTNQQGNLILKLLDSMNK